MIEATEMLQKVGRQKFKEIVLKSQRGETMGSRENRRRWGKNVKHRRCEHGTWIIENYKPKNCRKCFKVSSHFISKDVDYTGFNIGLGAFTEGKSDFNKTVKAKGLVHMGTDR